MRILLLIAAICAAAAGSALASGRARPAAADQGVSIHTYSGALYGASWLTCGWHTSCSGGANYERGLDFATPNGYPDKKGYFTGWAFSGDTQNTIRATGTRGDSRPGPLSNCITTSVDIRDTFGNLQVRYYDVHVSRSLSGTFYIWAKQFGLGGYWNGDIQLGNQVTQSGCTGTALHAMTWYDGMVPGVINILPRDYWWNCPNSSGFYFPCFNITPYQLPHDLNDWEYVMYW